MKNRFGAALWGVLLIILGIILGGNVLGIWYIDIFFPGWWTLFIIVPCIYNIVKDGFHPGNTVGLLIGVVFLCSAWGLFSWHLIWKMVIPFLLVVIGISLVVGRRNRRYEGEEYRGDTGNISAFCCGQELRIENAPYRGGTVSATLGGVELDLRNALITEDITIKARSFMGGIEIYFPPNVRVEVQSSPFLGGVENKISAMAAAFGPTVFVDCRPVLGGIELK
ncbi:MAG TPA: hypothetical protein H9669_02990 [Firmicutes bacterium]|nr:hypothetical protein [Bacillota bacterium]